MAQEKGGWEGTNLEWVKEEKLEQEKHLLGERGRVVECEARREKRERVKTENTWGVAVIDALKINLMEKLSFFGVAVIVFFDGKYLWVKF